MADGSWEAANQLAEALTATGLPCVIENEEVSLASLGVKVRIADVDIREAGVVVIYDLSQLESSEPGIRVLAVGLGGDPIAALGQAAFQWILGVLQPVQHWLQPTKHMCFVEDFHLLVRTQDTSEHFAWRVHVGPIISRAFGPDESEAPIPAEPKDIFGALLRDVQSRAAHRTLFWVEAYVIRYGDGRLDSTCRFRNDDWPEGTAALIEWAQTWNLNCAASVSVRQFLLFEPVAASKLPDQKGMIAALEEYERNPAPSWWRRLLKCIHR